MDKMFQAGAQLTEYERQLSDMSHDTLILKTLAYLVGTEVQRSGKTSDPLLNELHRRSSGFYFPLPR